MSNHDGIYLLQSAISSYLTTNKATYASAVAAALPIVQAGDFGDRGRDHIYVMVEDYAQDPPLSGSYQARVMVGVATVRETTLATHQSYCRAVFDLLCDSELASYLSSITGNKIRVYQVEDDHSFSLGAVTDSLRFAQVTFGVRCYLST
jgi:hypothetical protein